MSNPMERSPQNFNADGISDLPDNIIDSILSRLSLREAIRTSILSRKWRYRWTSIPELVFDFRFDRTFLRDHKLENVIYQLLLRHKGPILKFALQVPSYRSGPDIDHWILLLSRSHVQDFTLHLSAGDKHQLTSHFFAFQNLRHLNLYRCVFKPPPRSTGFNLLITLDFQDVDFVPVLFIQFISQCPLLESMRLVGCTEWDFFLVEGPCLRSFTFHGVFKDIYFKNSPVLAEVSLSIPIVETWGIRSVTGFNHFHLMSTLEKLNLHPGVVEFLGAGGRYAGILKFLKVLNLSMYLDNINEVASAFSLARTSPNLQMLRVTLYTTRAVKAVTEVIRTQKRLGRYLDQLRRVCIDGFSGFEPEVEFVKHILASAAGLEEMVITPYFSSHCDDARFMNQLKQFPRASSTSKVLVRNARDMHICF